MHVPKPVCGADDAQFRPSCGPGRLGAGLGISDAVCAIAQRPEGGRTEGPGCYRAVEKARATYAASVIGAWSIVSQIIAGADKGTNVWWLPALLGLMALGGVAVIVSIWRLIGRSARQVEPRSRSALGRLPTLARFRKPDVLVSQTV